MTRRKIRAQKSPEQRDGGDQFEGVGIDQMMSLFARHWKLFLVCTTVSVILSGIYSLNAVPLFSAQASLFLDVSKKPLINRFVGAETPTETDGSLLSELEVMRSEAVANAVIKKLDLINNPEFMSRKDALSEILFDKISSLIPGWSKGQQVLDADQLHRAAIAKLQDGASISRVAQSYIFTVGYMSTSPELSAQIANALSEAYVADRVNSTYESLNKAGDWLKARVDDLRDKTREAGLAVEQYRAAHGLVSNGTQLISEQRLGELNTALTEARGDAANAKARYENLKSLTDAGRVDVIINDPAGSKISNDLRGRYLDASKREADIAAKYGANHEQAVKLREEMSGYERQMLDELTRVLAGYKSDMDIAQTHVDTLQTAVDGATGVSNTADENNVELRDLERTLNTYQNMSKIFLDRYQQAIQQESFPITSARVITPAERPDIRIYPRHQLLLFLGFLLGATLSFIIALFLESRRKSFEDEMQVSDELGLDLLGATPFVAQKNLQMSSYVAQKPFSAVAETMRSVKIAIDFQLGGKLPKVVGIVSVFPGEGSSWVANNFAALLASQGNRTMLIDGDMRNKTLTKLHAPASSLGIVDVLLGEKDVREVQITDAKTRFRFLPAGLRRQLANSAQLLASPTAKTMLSNLGVNHDYIVVDLPPIGTVVDARAIAPEIDVFILVIDQPRTQRKAVRSALAQSQAVADKCLGVVLNKVEAKSYGSLSPVQDSSRSDDMALAGE